MSDEEIQKRFESGLPVEGNDRDIVFYREVFRIAGKEPRTKVGNAFAESVVKKIVVKKKREARRDIIWLSFGVVFLLIGLVVTAAIAGLQFELGFLKEMSGYAGVFIFGVAVIIAFNWLEKKTLSKKLSH